MRLILSFILPLIAVLALIAYATIPLLDSLTYAWAVHDLEARSRLIARAVQDDVVTALDQGDGEAVRRIFDRTVQDERLFALGFCDRDGRLLFKTALFPADVDCAAASAADGAVKVDGHPLHSEHLALRKANSPARGDLIVLHDMDFVNRRSADARRYLLYLFVILILVTSFVAGLIAQLNWRRFVGGLRGLLRGETRRSRIGPSELAPFAKDLRVLIRDIGSERRSRDESRIAWTPAELKRILREDLAGDEIITVSNREPYIHNLRNGRIETQFPASGLVTALEPVMRACSGTWIAHGSGTADRRVVDKFDHVSVPPDQPSYQIRRVWLSREEERGYYYGFSNEGLWPLCHMAYTRPVFRTEDWEHYKAVNARFADVVVEEARTADPVILVQDYHMALLPRMIRDRLPAATIISFWHIPWPNPEAFGICPWREEILDGLLGSSILGFHTRYHCNNFIDTVDRYLESRIDRETSTITRGGKPTAVKSYPISIEWPARFEKDEKSIHESRAEIRRWNDLAEDALVGVGVDRLDYTKGILERFSAVERLLEREPEWIGRFSLIQIAAPSRSSIEPYQSFEAEVRAVAARINARFGRADGYKPILLKIEHHEPELVFEYFRGCDVCLVTSLHDGMNLVAKEFVASRDDERGVLILSQFTGAAHELDTALIVNPYDIDQCATALHLALAMSPDEQRDRMRSMRGLLQEFNVYRWAGRMLMDAARTRQQARLHGRLSAPEVTG